MTNNDDMTLDQSASVEILYNIAEGFVRAYPPLETKTIDRWTTNYMMVFLAGMLLGLRVPETAKIILRDEIIFGEETHRQMLDHVISLMTMRGPRPTGYGPDYQRRLAKGLVPPPEGPPAPPPTNPP